MQLFIEISYGLFKGFGIFCETPTNADAIFAGPLS